MMRMDIMKQRALAIDCTKSQKEMREKKKEQEKEESLTSTIIRLICLTLRVT